MKFSKIILCLAAASFIILLALKPALAAENKTSDEFKPIILETAKILDNQQNSLLVKGLTQPGYEVLIYLNGEYIGLANISQISTEIYSFSYQSPATSELYGSEVMAIARDPQTRILSSPAQAVVLTILEKGDITPAVLGEVIRPKFPAIATPILLTPNDKNCLDKPYISGYTKNRNFINLYIDDKFYTKFLVTGKNSDKVYFSYLPGEFFARGDHSVYATAQDKDGQVSQKSNSLGFCILNPQTAATSTIENEEGTLATTTISEPANENSISPNNTTNNVANNKEKGSNSLWLNYLLFGIFVIAIIAWVILVNRELQKEQDDLPEKPDQT